MSSLATIEDKHLKKDLTPFHIGDTVKVHVAIKEGDKERIQVFQGEVIAHRGKGLGESFTVRKVSFGVGVEKVFPFHGKTMRKIEVVRKGKVRRAKLYYLRQLRGKAARLREERD
jgi:large subunit ribosomal protein L19